MTGRRLLVGCLGAALVAVALGGCERAGGSSVGAAPRAAQPGATTPRPRSARWTEGWVLGHGAAVSPAGTVVGGICCTRSVELHRPLWLPAGGVVEAELAGPCGSAMGLVARVDGAGTEPLVATGPAGAFDGALRLTIPADRKPRTLTVVAEGGLHCCGDVEIRTVRELPLPAASYVAPAPGYFAAASALRRSP